MRPLELVIDGFRSHHDRTTIDWRGRRLVAIVGPIGSGKSSILDAIAFALFGRTPTFGKERLALINQRRDHFRVELAFEVDQRVLRAVRVIRKKGPAVHSLHEHPGGDPKAKPKEVASGDDAVTRYIAGVLGLDFETFCRSVLLAQNRFSEFLSSRAGERDQVLKKVFGFERVDEMREEAKRRVDALAKELAGLEVQRQRIVEDRQTHSTLETELVTATRRLEELSGLAPEIAELTLRREASGRKAQECDAELVRLQALTLPPVARIKRALDARHEADDGVVTASRAQHEAELAVTAADAARLAMESGPGSPTTLQQAERLLIELEERRRSLDELGRKQDTLDQENTVATRELERSRAQLASAEAALEAAARAQGETALTLESTSAARAAVEAEVGDRAALDQLRARLAELARVRETLAVQRAQECRVEGRARDAETAATAAIAASADCAAALVITREKLATKEHEVGVARAAFDKADEELRRLVEVRGDRDALLRRRDEVRELAGRRTALTAATRKAEESAAQARGQAASVVDARSALEAARRAEATAQGQLEAARSAVAAAAAGVHEARHAEMALALRGELEIGQPCPVCEQLVHAAPAERTSVNIDAAMARNDAALLALSAADAASRAASATVSALQQRVAGNEERAVELAREVERTQRALAVDTLAIESEESALHAVLGAGDLGQLVGAALAAHEDATRRVAAVSETLRKAEAADTLGRHELQLLDQQQRGLQEQRTQLEVLRRAELEELNVIREGSAKLEATMRELEGSTLPEAALAEAERLLAGAERKLEAAATGAQRATAAAEEARHEVEKRKLGVDGIAAQVAAVARRSAEIVTEREDASAECDKRSRALVDLLGAGEPHALLDAAREAIRHSEQRVLDASREKARAEKCLEQARGALNKAQQGEGALVAELASIAGQLGHRPPTDVSPDLRELADTVTSLHAEGRARCREAREAALAAQVVVDAERRQLLASVALDPDDDYTAVHADARAKHDSLRRRIAELADRIAEQASLGERVESLSSEQRLFAQLVDDLTANRFTAYLLAEERTRLTELGSQRLELLTAGRYRFAADGTFDILDLSNAGEQRDARTLSGGETFLASLALALALAERVSLSGGRLDAFFLDEGFGSLDPPHIDLAMDGIERLVDESKNRLVAIVSHVEALKERIDDLIVLDKDPLTGDTIRVC